MSDEDIEPVISDEAAYMSHFQVDGPYWPDDCGHGGYVGTVWPILDTGKRMIVDVYVFSGIRGDEVCLRFGRGSDYYSPGGIDDFILRSNCDIYRDSRKLLLSVGTLTWARKEESRS